MRTVGTGIRHLPPSSTKPSATGACYSNRAGSKAWRWSRQDCSPPPVQIRACGFRAPGSCLRSDVIGHRGMGYPCSSDPWARCFTVTCRIPALCPGHASRRTLPSTGRLPSTVSAADVTRHSGAKDVCVHDRDLAGDNTKLLVAIGPVRTSPRTHGNRKGAHANSPQRGSRILGLRGDAERGVEPCCAALSVGRCEVLLTMRG